MDSAGQRAALEALIAERGVSCAALSRLLGRNPAYVQQYVKRGSPRELPERERRVLAQYLGVAEARLGGPDVAGLVAVPRLDVRASAGPGALVGGERRVGGFPAAVLRELGVREAAASTIRVEGDSMAPTLADGDEILVDGDQRRPDARGGLYVLRLDGALLVKRLRAARGQIEVISDNPDHADAVRPAGEVDVVGRVVWLGRALS